MSAIVILHALLACELSPQPAPERLLLERAGGDALAGAIADDLQRLLPGIEHARLLLGTGLLDATEILRPGFAAHAALAELGLRLPRGHGAVIAIGAHHGRMPAAALTPAAEFSDAPMRYLPLLIEAEAEHADALGTRLEQVLANAGEASARSADVLMRSYGLRLQHARYLSLTDLLALTCVQYEHAGFAAHWPLIEAALLTPARREATLSPRGARWQWTGAHVALETPRAFVARTQPDPDARVHAYAAAVFELRQAAALFRAHALSLTALDDASGVQFSPAGVIEILRAPDARAAPGLHACTAPGLGIVALLLGDSAAREIEVLATPLDAAGLPVLLATLAARSDCTQPRRDAPLAEVDVQGMPWPRAPLRH
ncbi:hypothetical protein [Metallibacterium sp.]|uniref:hypothetical protein n=1 Tax=Metallibacterium sp. TaxID=2940281 RepID=UPI0026302DE2|nr:hypothetical protein [Metallibacterium sp.]